LKPWIVLVISRNSGLPIVARAHRHAERKTAVDAPGSFSYNNLLNASSDVATGVACRREDLQDERMAFAGTPGFPWVAVLWAYGGPVALLSRYHSTPPGPSWNTLLTIAGIDSDFRNGGGRQV